MSTPVASNFAALLSREQAANLVSRERAAKYLGVAKQTLAVWASTHRYDLPYIRVGRAVRYRIADLDRWLASRTVGAVEE